MAHGCEVMIETAYQKVLRVLKRRYCDWLEQRYLKLPSELEALTYVEESEALGRSVFAACPIAAGTLLGVYPGQKLRRAELVAKEEFVDRSMRYSYCLDDGTVIDPTDLFGHLANKAHLRLAMINEPPPGAAVNVLPINSSRHVWYVALNNLAPGDELFTSYGTKYVRSYPSEMVKTKGKVELSNADKELLQIVVKQYPWLQL